MDVLCCTASILSLCALGWERHDGVTRPLERAQRASRARLVALLVWPVSAAVAAPAAFLPFPRHQHGQERACVVNTNVGYVMLSAILSFYLPAVVTLVLYWRVVNTLGSQPPLRAHTGRTRHPRSPDYTLTSCKLRSPTSEQKQNLQESTNLYLSPKGKHLGIPWLSNPNSYLGDVFSPSSLRSNSPFIGSGAEDNEECRYRRRQMRATRTIVLIMALFLISWTPFFITLPIDAICSCVSDTALWCSTWLGYANSALNPLVYAATSPALRRAFSTTSGTRLDVRHFSPNRLSHFASPVN